ncbi:VOC family protein [Hyphomonas sp. NPDC076900]|uniref:VOC family protein n=1 Tax=unclassified Hyphomonas TaxID=2630699 RepID=UPI003CFD695D
MKITTAGVLIAAWLCAGCALAPEAPPAAAEGAPALLGSENPYPVYPINLRRTTLVVRDAEASLRLYRDALGFEVVYDQELTSPGLETRHGADGINRSRLVLTQTNSAAMGMIGLWQFLDQTEKDTTPPGAADFTPGNVVLLFNTTDLESRFAAASAVPGVQVISAPAERHYPSPAGDIIVMVSMLVDPDGYTIELNQMISDPRAAR